MKKYLITSAAALALCGLITSCTHELDYEASVQNSVVKKYEDAFVTAFGKPDPNQEWGFGSSTVVASRAMTRGSLPDKPTFRDGEGERRPRRLRGKNPLQRPSCTRRDPHRSCHLPHSELRKPEEDGGIHDRSLQELRLHPSGVRGQHLRPRPEREDEGIRRVQIRMLRRVARGHGRGMVPRRSSGGVRRGDLRRIHRQGLPHRPDGDGDRPGEVLLPHSVNYLEVQDVAAGVVGLPAVAVVRLTRNQMHAAHVPEPVQVRVRGLVGVSRMGMGGTGDVVVYRGHPLVEEAVAVPVDRAGEEDHLRDYPVYLAGHAEELVRIGGAGGLVEPVDEVYVDADNAVHSPFTSFSRTRE